RLGAGPQHRSGTKVTERADQRTRADVGVDDDGVRADLGACGNPARTADDRERMDGRVRFQLDGRVDPGRLRVDDRRAGKHVRVVDPVAQDGRGRGELRARVHADLRLVVVLVD